MAITKRRVSIALAAIAAILLIPFISSKVIAASGLDDDVKLLLHGGVIDQSVPPYFIDSSFSAHTVTGNGNASQVLDKFSQSGFFDGSGDYLSIPDSADFAFGTGDFTIDFWVRLNSTATIQTIVSKRLNSENSGPFHIIFNSGSGNFEYWSSSSGAWDIASGVSMGTATTGVWYHLAVVRSGNTYYLFKNGAQVSTFSNSSSLVSNSSVVYVAAQQPGYYLNGQVDEVRISKGIARWTSNFTPPTSAYASDGNTSLLLHMDGTAGSTTFTDSSGSPKTVTANGSAHINSFSKFGRDGITFDGSNDYLEMPSSADWNLGPTGGSNDFTIDFWVKFNTETVTQMRLLSAETSNGWKLYMHDNSTISLWTASGPVDTRWTWDPVAYTWYHVALVRTGTTFKFFINGTSLGDGTERDMNNNGSALAIGRAPSATGSFGSLNGFMDEIRISKGIARWTSNFTPPTEAYGLGPAITLTGNVKFLRNIAVIDKLSKGAGTFVIDHPQKPRTHLLYHSFVESNEVKNLYDGIVELDESGEAIIRLPDYFEELNKDFRYQYFPIGEPMPNLHVKEKVKDNQFVLAGGKPGGRVSWQVTGVRHDPYIEANPLEVEVEKGPGELIDKGECLHAEACP